MMGRQIGKHSSSTSSAWTCICSHRSPAAPRRRRPRSSVRPVLASPSITAAPVAPRSTPSSTTCSAAWSAISTGFRSETRLCEEVHLNLAYRWFCRLGLDGYVPERSTFSKNRHGRFREGDLFRRLFEEVVNCLCGGRPGRWHGCGGGRKRRRGRCQSRAPPARRSPARGMVKSGEPGAARPGGTPTRGTLLPHRLATSPSRLRQSTYPRPILRRPGRPRPARGASVMRPTTWATPRMR